MIIVTGGSGKAGRACIRELKEHGHEVTSVDQMRPAGSDVRFSLVNLTDFGQTMAALSAIDERVAEVSGVVHLAAIPAPGLAPNHVIFETNMLSTYNVFEAARQLAITNIVSAYSLSKLLGEEMAKQFCRWDPELKIFGLRFSNIMEPEDYAAFADFQDDGKKRKWNLWGYIDARDAAQAVRLALESKLKGADVFIIANAETVMAASNEELLRQEFPEVPRKRAFAANETLLSIEKACRVLGYAPRFGWRASAEARG